MKINKIQAFSAKRQMGFGSDVTLDIGGSQKEGSCKIYYATSKDHKEIYTENTLVNDIGKTKFEDQNEFKERIANKVTILQNLNRRKLQEMNYPEDENVVQSLTIFIPSYTSNTLAYYLPNYKNKDNKPLNRLDFADMKERLIANGVEVAPDMKFMLLQDSMGAGLTVAKRLYQNGLLEKGKYYTVGITGGGCGISNIEMHDDEKVVIKSSGSAYLAEGTRLEKVSKAGASAPAVIRNFCRTFDIGEELLEDIVSCRKAEFVLNNPFTLKRDEKTEKLKNLLLKTEKYNLDTENDKSYTMSVKPEYGDLYALSQKNAIDKYCHAFARLAIIKKAEASNGLIITGPLAKALNKTAIEKFNMSVSDWVKYHMKNTFDSHELEIMQDNYDFKILCDDRFSVFDNTACKELSHKVSFVEPKRGNWIQINVEHFKE